MEFTTARLNMVESQVRPNGVTDARVTDAMAQVRREDFVPPSRRNVAYSDGAIPLGDGRYLMEPMALGRMLQSAMVKPQDTVMIVGAGTGYSIAVMAQLAHRVVAVEANPRLAAELEARAADIANVTIVHGPHSSGHAGAAPYDVILIEGRVEDMPDALLAQLADGGELVAGMGARDACALTVITKTGTSHSNRSTFDVPLALLPGFAAKRPEFVL
jgi:protein-L-isoaspartate(D-aspartate) O-methyltransferase